MIILLVFAFLSGLVTIAAPCIWPLLPIVLSASAFGGDHRRPLGVTLGILLSFGVLTITISYLVQLFAFDADIFRIISVVILLFLGMTMVIPPLTRIVESVVSRFAGRIGQSSKSTGGFLSGFISGLALGIVWTPCAGPILATIATLASTRAVSSEIILVTIVYLMGVGIPLFIFAFAGQKIIQRSRFINRYTGMVQKIFGVIIILTALLIYTNYDKIIQAKLLDAFPGLTSFVTNFENNASVQNQLNILKGQKSISSNTVNDLFNENRPAPEFVGITNWLNTDKPLTLDSLKGKVVLIDFWTYTCINCIRTLPHVTRWYDKYKDQGFVVIGVHTPEFEFEKKASNVQNAIKQFNIHYPVPQDNNYSTWNAYSNRYWPAEYLIDAKGTIRRTHFGEGEYAKMEQAIMILLKEAGQEVDTSVETMPDETPRGRLSPESYLGSSRMQYLFPNGNAGNGKKTLTLAKNLPVNSFSLGGEWTIADEDAVAGKNAVLEYHFTASKVFLVLRPGSATNATVKVLLDGKVVDSLNSGSDVTNGIVTIDSDRLYELIRLSSQQEHILRLEFQTPGIQAFAFTFG